MFWPIASAFIGSISCQNSSNDGDTAREKDQIATLFHTGKRCYSDVWDLEDSKPTVYPEENLWSPYSPKRYPFEYTLGCTNHHPITTVLKATMLEECWAPMSKDYVVSRSMLRPVLMQKEVTPAKVLEISS